MFRGTLTALITPFRGGGVDGQALRELVEKQIQDGIHGLVACGTTGEASAMGVPERLDVIRLVIEQAAGRVPVIAGTGGNSTAATLEFTRQAAELGPDGVLVVTPYYVKPTQRGLIQHFEQVAKVGPPVVVYNVPGRTGVSITAETAEALSRIPNVVALKEASADMRLDADVARRVGERLALLSGDDFTYLPFLAIGGSGCISVVSNVAPAAMAQLYEKFRSGDINGARKLQLDLLPLMEALFLESNPIPVKAAAEMLGLCSGELRLPLTPLAENMRPRLKEALLKTGLLEK